MRKLTIYRDKSVVAMVMKVFVYLPDVNGEKTLDGITCSMQGIIKNGKQITIEIPEEETVLFIVFDKNFPQKFKAKFVIPEGQEDVEVHTKPRLNPLRGNPFEIYQ